MTFENVLHTSEISQCVQLRTITIVQFLWDTSPHFDDYQKKVDPDLFAEFLRFVFPKLKQIKLLEAPMYQRDRFVQLANQLGVRLTFDEHL